MAAGFQTYRSAYDLLVRCMIYLRTPDRDLEAGFFAGAPVSMQRKRWVTLRRSTIFCRMGFQWSSLSVETSSR